MARGTTQRPDGQALGLIVTKMKRKKMNQSQLAELVDVHRGTISRFLAGKQGASATTLSRIAQALNIPPERLLIQYELEFEIDDRFEALAQKALSGELARLRSELGRVRAVRVTGSVGVRLHGVAPEERVVERVFAFRVPQRARR